MNLYLNGLRIERSEIMKIISLASGSSANVTLVITTKYNLLLDCGLSMKQINQKLLISEGIDLNDVHFIIITHLHSDHIMSFNAIYNKYQNIRFIMDIQLHKNLLEHFKKDYSVERFIILSDRHKGESLSITEFQVQHDTYCLSYVIEDLITGESLAFIADNGMYPYKLKDIEILHKPHTYYCVESNYDNFSQYLDETRNELLKRRVLSTNGHSDNFNAIEKVVIMLEQSNNITCKGIMFTHLSTHCNTEEIAKQSHQAYIATWGKKTLFKNIKIKYGLQNEIVEL